MDLFSIIFVILIAFPLISFIYKRYEIYQYRKHDYHWYRQAFPECVRTKGVVCYACGHHRIHTRSLMERRYTRVHFCAQCGENLYFSAE